MSDHAHPSADQNQSVDTAETEATEQTESLRPGTLVVDREQAPDDQNVAVVTRQAGLDAETARMDDGTRIADYEENQNYPRDDPVVMVCFTSRMDEEFGSMWREWAKFDADFFHERLLEQTDGRLSDLPTEYPYVESRLNLADTQLLPDYSGPTPAEGT